MNEIITLTKEEAIDLKMVLLLTQKFREEEEAACKRLGEELDHDGNLKYPNQALNAEWWSKTNMIVEEIMKKL